MGWKRLVRLLGIRNRVRADGRAIRTTRGGYQSVLDREATPTDLEHLRAFARSRRGVELYVEPETSVTDTTAVAVAGDGEWTRRRVGSPPSWPSPSTTPW